MRYDFPELVAEMTEHVERLEGLILDAVFMVAQSGAKRAAAYARYETGADHDSILESPFAEVVPGIGVRGGWGSEMGYDLYQEFGTTRGITPNFHHRRAFMEIAPVYLAAMKSLANMQGKAWEQEVRAFATPRGMMMDVA